MNRPDDEKGIALVMVLILAAISLSIMAALVYMLMSSTQISGSEKRYKTAMDASKGGAEVLYQIVGTRGVKGDLDSVVGIVTTGPGSLWSTITTPSTCTGTNRANVAFPVAGNSGIQTKLMTPSTSWSAACNSGMTVGPASYDMAVDFGLGLGSNYRVYLKIADTVEGNSGNDNGLIQNGTTGINPEVNVQNIPFLYTIEVDAENSNNPLERAKYSILYAY